jgi:HAD superfamily hydrolase (TIGR01509 family)
MRAVLLGSIGVLAETSEVQRAAFNAAFAEHGLGWHWSQAEYREMLGRSGGQARVAAYAQARGVAVDAGAVHRRKSALFREMLAAQPPGLRPGVAATLDGARARGLPVALVTATAPENVAALLAAVGVPKGAFDTVVHAGRIGRGKPAPDAYLRALDDLGLPPAAPLAVEDNPDGVAAARAAGVPCVAFPGALHAGAAFPGDVPRLSVLDLSAHLAA